MSDISYERRKAVAKAWENEKQLVKEGKGTRDWNQKEQREILSKGKVKGYEGHHMKSVDGHNSKAGDANNIQFLNRKEHLAAHGGNFRNNTNGYYDYTTGKMHSFGRNKASVDSKELSTPLSQVQRNNAMSKKDSSKQIEAAREKAKATESRRINKQNNSQQKSSQNKVSIQSKTLSSQRNSQHIGQSLSSTNSKTLSSQRETNASQGKTTSGQNTVGKSNSSGVKNTRGR